MFNNECIMSKWSDGLMYCHFQNNPIFLRNYRYTELEKSITSKSTMERSIPVYNSNPCPVATYFTVTKGVNDNYFQFTT